MCFPNENALVKSFEVTSSGLERRVLAVSVMTDYVTRSTKRINVGYSLGSFLTNGNNCTILQYADVTMYYITSLYIVLFKFSN